MIVFDLPFPPSVNKYYRRVGKNVVISKRGREYREEVISIFKGLKKDPIDGQIAMGIDAYPPDKRRRDIDNILKALLDALEHAGAYQNDNQIVKLLVSKHEPMTGGKVIVRIYGKD